MFAPVKRLDKIHAAPDVRTSIRIKFAPYHNNGRQTGGASVIKLQHCSLKKKTPKFECK